MVDDLPLQSALSSSNQLYIGLLERQLSITYPQQSLEDSPELRRLPLIKLAVGLIIVLGKCSGPGGREFSHLLLRWLHLEENELPSIASCKEMVWDESFLKLLYRRGIADCFPPVLATHPLPELYTVINVVTTATDITFRGTECKIISIRTPPIRRGWLDAHCRVDKKAGYSTHYRLRLIIDDIVVGPSSIEEDEDAIEDNPVTARSVSILIFNARGACSPSFLKSFTQRTSELNPDITIVTETRTALNSLEVTEHTSFDSSLTIDPVLFFGGVWFLWSSRIISIQDIGRRRRSLMARFDLLPH